MFKISDNKNFFTEKDIRDNVIAEIKEVKKFELKESPSLEIISGCDDINIYDLEKINSEGKIYVKTDPSMGKHLVASFLLFKKRDISYSHFRIKRMARRYLFDFSEFEKINFMFKSESPTNILNFIVEEVDNDMWHYINVKEFKPDKWYLISIPLEKMYIYGPHHLEKHGNNKKDLNQIRGYWFDFSKLNGLVKAEDIPIRNIVHFGKVFLTR